MSVRDDRLGDVERRAIGEPHRVDGVLDPLADHVQLPLEPHVGDRCGWSASPRPMNTCRNDRLDGDRARAEAAVVGRHVAPAEHPLPLFGDDLLEQRLDLARAAPASRGRNTNPAPYWRAGGSAMPRRGRLLPEELVRHLDEDAGAVAGVRLAAAGAAVQQVDQDLERLRGRSRATAGP